MDINLSLASGLASLQATACFTSVSGSTEIEPPPSPPFAKPVSWHGIDAATLERKANMQQDIAAQELRAVKRCLDLRESITRTAREKIFDPELLVVPRSWPISGTPLKMLVKHPTLLEEYLKGEQFSRVAIKIRREYLESEDRDSPEIKRLAAMEADFRNTQSSRALVDLLLEAIQHVTQKLVLEITEGEKTTKRPVSKLCRRLVAHSTHTNGELIQAVEAINDMEREHMPWRCNALDDSTETSPISDIPSAVPPLDSPPADDICLSPEPISSPPPNETSPPKDPRRLRVKFQENLPSRSSALAAASVVFIRSKANRPQSRSWSHNSSCGFKASVNKAGSNPLARVFAREYWQEASGKRGTTCYKRLRNKAGQKTQQE
ncbi:hypothetical protein J4E91_010561 [Alternaria rosae]|nr:hypothetical protein J4E91_010561 [Alternaria rosae]